MYLRMVRTEQPSSWAALAWVISSRRTRIGRGRVVDTVSPLSQKDEWAVAFVRS